jgi:4-carboxymuconolactone decarboxylase
VNPTLEGLLGEIGRYAPAAADGYARIRALIDADGALPASQKALMVAVNASRARDPELAQSELRRANALGLPPRQRAAALTTLLLSRGESLAAAFAAAAGPIDPGGNALPAYAGPPDQYLREYLVLDVLPPRMSQLADRVPEAFAGYAAMHHAALRADPALSLLGELILCSLNAVDLETEFIAIHAAGARRVGATDEQLVEAVLCAIPVSGVGAWAAAAAALF